MALPYHFGVYLNHYVGACLVPDSQNYAATRSNTCTPALRVRTKLIYIFRRGIYKAPTSSREGTLASCNSMTTVAAAPNLTIAVTS
jgi:hypothetical protein